jgi:hypothetical protein
MHDVAARQLGRELAALLLLRSADWASLLVVGVSGSGGCGADAAASAFSASASSSASSSCAMTRSIRSELAPNFSRRNLAICALSFSIIS